MGTMIGGKRSGPVLRATPNGTPAGRPTPVGVRSARKSPSDAPRSASEHPTSPPRSAKEALVPLLRQLIASGDYETALPIAESLAFVGPDEEIVAVGKLC